MLAEEKQYQKSISAGKKLTSEKQDRSTTIQDKPRKCLKADQEILRRQIDHCSELYNFESYGGNTVLDCNQHTEEDLQPILRKEVEITEAIFKS